MSVGKILRKIVKKWLKKDSETGSVVDPAEYELYAETTTVPLVATARNLDSEPCLHDCMFCVDGSTSYGGDLNRNRVHISDNEMGFSEMGFSSDSIGSSYRKKCRLDDEWDCELSSSERTSYSSSCPLHGGGLGGLNSFMGDNNPTKFPFDAASTCHSSQSPVPLCVCETCYIFVSSHLSLRIPSTPSSASPRTPDAGGGGGGHPDDAGCWSNQRPTGPPDSTGKASSGKMVRLGMTTKDVRTTTTTTECNEDSSISVTSNRRFHSVMNPKSPSCSVEQLPKMTTTTTTGIGGGGGGGGHVNLPQSVHVSLDGEEGFGEGQRRLRCINRWEDAMAPHKSSFRPPPNKTICHVAK